MSTAPPLPTSGEPAGQPPQQPPQQPQSRYSLGSYSNMVRSLVVILGMVGVLIAIVPRVSSVQQPPVDAAAVAADAVTQANLPFELPVDLPAGWSATNARYGPSTDGLPTWQAGWSTPAKGYVAIRQTKTASPAWLQAATNDGKQTGTKQIAGRTWAVYVASSDGRTSLVDIPTGAETPTSLATVITALADDAEVQTFAAALQPATSR